MRSDFATVLVMAVVAGMACDNSDRPPSETETSEIETSETETSETETSEAEGAFDHCFERVEARSPRPTAASKHKSRGFDALDAELDEAIDDGEVETSTAEDGTTESSEAEDVTETWDVGDHYASARLSEGGYDFGPIIRPAGEDGFRVVSCKILGFEYIWGRITKIRVHRDHYEDPGGDGCGWVFRWLQTLQSERVPAGTPFKIFKMYGELIVQKGCEWEISGHRFQCKTVAACESLAKIAGDKGTDHRIECEHSASDDEPPFVVSAK
jgi:hypothetical protein